MRATLWPAALAALGALQACSPPSGDAPAASGAPAAPASAAAPAAATPASPPAPASAPVPAASALQSSASASGVVATGSALTSTSSGLQSQVSNLDSLVSAMGGEVRGQEIHIDMPADTLFDFDQAEIRPQAASELAKLAAVLRATQGPVRLVGHTDGKGAQDYNQRLSERRATAVVDWLKAQGLPAERLQAEGRGAGEPIAANQRPDGSDDPEGRAKNRRVQAIITK